MIQHLAALAALQTLAMPVGTDGRTGYGTTHERALDVLRDITGRCIAATDYADTLCYVDGFAVRHNGTGYALAGEDCATVRDLMAAIEDL